ncbi:GNAT family N-acetyltransferase [Micromonospora sp. WMMD1082]|uniref:GNAT family N-acetyltransferase n=1 Tax=Micromonospora sp. WMMD1082 TaxID=3016104 RepID=UPI002416A4F4|nr:GNAT family N-acetyltransferase [Micromonospora sp. WMMD1082]MDG4796116.1 GNAT family N-acetyltransferase [Micromonospora sp. WMMD1082]
MLIECRPLADPEVAALVMAQQRELGEPATSWDGGRYLAAVVGGRAVACGGLREVGDGVGELSGPYVRPAFRRRGIARQLLAALEELAFRHGHSVLCVELGAVDTGAVAPAAVSLYRSCGYEPVPACPGAVGGGDRVRLAKRLLVAA